MKIYRLEPNSYFEPLDKVINKLEWKIYKKDYNVKHFIVGFVLFEFNIDSEEELKGFIDILKNIKEESAEFFTRALAKFFFSIDKNLDVKFIYDTDLSLLYNLKLFLLNRSYKKIVKSLTKSLKYEKEYKEQRA